ncbi:MAG: tetratricopeptide repeat protein [Chloroflexota bacterium]
MSEMTEQLIQQAVTEAKAGNKANARAILSRVVKQEPKNARAWYFLSQVVEEREQAIHCLKKSLELNPDNARAKERLARLGTSEKTGESQSPQISQQSTRDPVSSIESVSNLKEKPTGVIYTMRGVQDLLEVYEDKVAITPKGVLGFLNKGLKGTKMIPFISITAIQFKKPGMTNGYLQFTLSGGNENGSMSIVV